MDKKRKIIQISVSAASEGLFLAALCNDGTIWYRNDVRSSWIRYPDIPQDTENVESEKIEQEKKTSSCCPNCKSNYTSDVGIFKVCENCGHRWT